MNAVASTQAAAPNRRWLALGFIALAQLLIALDATIVSIALPSAQAAFGASDADRQWVITAYSLSFAGLLLLGGRIADIAGRKRAFMVGLFGFAIASAVGGAAPSFAVLVAARAMQGAFAALLAPAALSLLAVTFTEARERATAFAVYGSIAGSGAAIGLLLGGALTQYFTWRWCLYASLPIALAAAAGGWFAVPDSTRRDRFQVDVVGALLATAGLAALVYACARASLPFGALSAVLLALFVVREARTPAPLLPLRILNDRTRAGVYLTVICAIAGMFGAFLFLTYFMQVVLRLTPLQAGLGFLPMTVASQAGSWLIASRLMPHVAPRVLMAPGALVAAAGMAWLTQLRADGSYPTLVLPAEVLLGVGTSCVMVAAFSTATQRIEPREAGIASATVNTAQQVGGSLGAALLNAIAIAASAGFTGARAAGIVHGFAVAAGAGVVILVAGAFFAALLITAPRPLTRA
ncbi:MAG: MFS transporter [Chloroflexi bacterium]|nr:MAG: MFS transporter [Chloroflexota bacterium]